MGAQKSGMATVMAEKASCDELRACSTWFRKIRLCTRGNPLVAGPIPSRSGSRLPSSPPCRGACSRRKDSTAATPGSSSAGASGNVRKGIAQKEAAHTDAVAEDLEPLRTPSQPSGHQFRRRTPLMLAHHVRVERRRHRHGSGPPADPRWPSSSGTALPWGCRDAGT